MNGSRAFCPLHEPEALRFNNDPTKNTVIYSFFYAHADRRICKDADERAIPFFFISYSIGRQRKERPPERAESTRKIFPENFQKFPGKGSKPLFKIVYLNQTTTEDGVSGFSGEIPGRAVPRYG